MNGNLLIIKETHENNHKSIYEIVPDYLSFLKFCINECDNLDPIIVNSHVPIKCESGYYLIICDSHIYVVNMKPVVSEGIIYNSTGKSQINIVTYSLINLYNYRQEDNDKLEGITHIETEIDYDTLLTLYTKYNMSLESITLWKYPDTLCIRYFRNSLSSLNTLIIKTSGANSLNYISKLDKLIIEGKCNDSDLKGIHHTLQIDEIKCSLYSYVNLSKFSPKKLHIYEISIPSALTNILSEMKSLKHLTISKWYERTVKDINALSNTVITYTK